MQSFSSAWNRGISFFVKNHKTNFPMNECLVNPKKSSVIVRCISKTWDETLYPVQNSVIQNSQHSTIINSQNAEYVSPDKTDIIIITTEDFCSYFQNNNQKAIKSFGNFRKDNSEKKKKMVIIIIIMMVMTRIRLNKAIGKSAWDEIGQGERGIAMETNGFFGVETLRFPPRLMRTRM